MPDTKYEGYKPNLRNQTKSYEFPAVGAIRWIAHYIQVIFLLPDPESGIRYLASGIVCEYPISNKEYRTFK
jgi:hypothetical protein